MAGMFAIPIAILYATGLAFLYGMMPAISFYPFSSWYFNREIICRSKSGYTSTILKKTPWRALFRLLWTFESSPELNIQSLK